jgi:hypothetical protein
MICNTEKMYFNSRGKIYIIEVSCVSIKNWILCISRDWRSFGNFDFCMTGGYIIPNAFLVKIYISIAAV